MTRWAAHDCISRIDRTVFCKNVLGGVFNSRKHTKAGITSLTNSICACSVCDDHGFKDDTAVYYRFRCDETDVAYMAQDEAFQETVRAPLRLLLMTHVHLCDYC